MAVQAPIQVAHLVYTHPKGCHCSTSNWSPSDLVLWQVLEVLLLGPHNVQGEQQIGLRPVASMVTLKDKQDHLQVDLQVEGVPACQASAEQVDQRAKGRGARYSARCRGPHQGAEVPKKQSRSAVAMARAQRGT